MAKWVCTGCNFRFEAEKEKECPYCGRDTTQKEPTASELLEEVEQVLQY